MSKIDIPFEVIKPEDLTTSTGEKYAIVFDPITWAETKQLLVGDLDENVKISSTDTTAGKLTNKLIAGTNITLTENNSGGDETLTIASTASGGGVGDFEASFPAGSFDYPVSNFAEFNIDTGVNGSQRRELFDDTTEEFLESDFVLPNTISGTVTFEVYGYASLAVASKNIKLKLYHSAKSDGENWDAAYSSKESVDLVPDSTQDQLDRFIWTETITNLGWTAGDKVRIKLSRISASINNLVGDYGITNLKIIVPRS